LLWLCKRLALAEYAIEFRGVTLAPAAALLADVDEAAFDQVVAIATQDRHESSRFSLPEVRAEFSSELKPADLVPASELLRRGHTPKIQ